jgi:lysophospholipase L1-like esterase
MRALVPVKKRSFISRRLALQTCVSGSLLFVAACTPLNRPVREADYPKPIRVACVGDSITFGFGIKDRARDSYPAQLQMLLGSNWQVMNFGFNGATLLKHGTRPYSRLPVYREAISFKPDVVIIKLGTNDTNQKDWPLHREDFISDYLELIHNFRELETRPRIYLCLPVPLFRDRGRDYDTDRILTEEVIPKIRAVARKAHIPVIDLHTEFADKAEMFPMAFSPTPAARA